MEPPRRLSGMKDLLLIIETMVGGRFGYAGPPAVPPPPPPPPSPPPVAQNPFLTGTAPLLQPAVAPPAGPLPIAYNPYFPVPPRAPSPPLEVVIRPSIVDIREAQRMRRENLRSPGVARHVLAVHNQEVAWAVKEVFEWFSMYHTYADLSVSDDAFLQNPEALEFAHAAVHGPTYETSDGASLDEMRDLRRRIIEIEDSLSQTGSVYWTHRVMDNRSFWFGARSTFRHTRASRTIQFLFGSLTSARERLDRLIRVVSAVHRARSR